MSERTELDLQDQWHAIAAFAKRMATDQQFANEFISKDDNRKVELAKQAVADVVVGKPLEIKTAPGAIICVCRAGRCVCIIIK